MRFAGLVSSRRSSAAFSGEVSGFATHPKAFKNAGLAELHFNGLRGTAVVNLAEARCTVPEIAAITGHSLKSVDTILETQAWNATAKLEAFRDKSGT